MYLTSIILFFFQERNYCPTIRKLQPWAPAIQLPEIPFSDQSEAATFATLRRHWRWRRLPRGTLQPRSLQWQESFWGTELFWIGIRVKNPTEPFNAFILRANGLLYPARYICTQDGLCKMSTNCFHCIKIKELFTHIV